MNKVFIALAVFLLGACTTVDVYFPAASATKAADKIINDVWQPVNAAAKEIK